MNGWFDVLVGPARFGRDLQSGRFSPPAAISLLLDGQLGRYLQLARDSAWPSIEQATSSGPAYRLPAALLLQVAGSPKPALFEEVVGDRDRDPAERALAGALVSALYADSGALPTAIQRLQDLADGGGFDGLELAYVHTHLGLRCIDAGQWERALKSVSIALGLLHEIPPGDLVGPLLRDVNLSNDFWARQLGLGEIKFADQGYSGQHLAQVEHLTAAALEADLVRSFEARFAARVVSIMFRGEDVAERSLWGAVLRSEALGDFQAVTQARANLGRYLLVSAAGIEGRSPEAGFALMLRGRDGVGLARAARVYLDAGPLNAVVRFGNHLSDVEWPPLVVVPAMKFLTESADVLDPDSIPRLLGRLCGDFARLIHPTAFTRAESDVLGAITAVARVGDPDTQTTAARFALELANATADGLTLQSMQPVLRAIDWSRQPQGLVDAWVDFIRISLNAKDDSALVAETALYTLLQGRPEELLSLARALRPNTVTVALAALESGAAGHLTVGEAMAAAEGLTETLQGIRNAAAKGSFSWGSSYDPGEVLGGLLLDRPELVTYWDSLVSYVADPQVSRAHKVDTLNLLASRFDALPESVRRLLRDEFAGIGTAETPALLPHAGFEAAWLRLGSQLGVLQPNRALQELLALASNASPVSRLQAATAVPFVRLNDDAAALSIVLLLSRDSDSAVRATASRALLIRSWGDSDHEDALVWPRVLELLSESGREPILGVLRGLYDGGDARATLPKSITSRVGLLATGHPSWAVRTMARRLESRWREQSRE